MAEPEETSRESEDRYKALVESAGDVICVIDKDGVFRFMNRAAAERLGGRPEDYICKTLWELFPKEIADRHMAAVRQVIETCQGLVTDSREPLLGELRWYHTSVQPLRDSEGHVGSALVVARDVTDGTLGGGALGEAEAKYRALVEQIPAITYTAALDEVSTTLYVSPQIADLLGFTPAEYRADPDTWRKRLHPEDRDRVMAEVAQSQKTGKPFVSEYRMVAKDGRVKSFRDEARIVRREDGSPLFLQGVMFDMTGRKVAEDAVRKSEERFRSIFERSFIGIELYDSQGRLVNANKACLGILGVTDEGALRGSDLFSELNLPKDARQRLEETGNVRFETTLGFDEVRSGSPPETSRSATIDLDVQITRLGEGNGKKPRGYLVHVQDITERTRAETALRESREEFESLLRSVQDVVWEATVDGETYLYLNPAVEEVYGRPREQLLANPDLWLEVVHPEDRPRVQKASKQLLEAGHVDLEYRIVRPDGQVRWLRDRKTVVYDQSGHAVRIGGIATDISQRKEAEEALRRHDAMLEGVGTVLAQALRARNAEELGEACLDVVQAITESKMSFIDEIGPDGYVDTLALSGPAWAACAMHDQTGHRKPPGDFPVHGIYGRVLIDGKALITNDPPSHPDSISVPEGHPRLTAFLGVPLAQEGKTVGMIGVANREGGYRIEDQQALETLAPVVMESLARKRAEDALRERSKQLRSLASQLTLAEQQERRRLAAVLHDDLAQILTLMKIKLSLLRGGSDESARLRGIEDIEPLVERANRVARSLMSQLSHPALYDMGFVRAAEWLTEDIRELYGLHVTMENDGEPKPMAEAVRVLLFHCLREVLVNAAKHAKVAEAHVYVRRQGPVIRVVVKDDGVGFDPSAAGANANGSGFGLFSIRERLEPLGGRVVIRSAAGKGTTVILEVPAEQEGGGR